MKKKIFLEAEKSLKSKDADLWIFVDIQPEALKMVNPKSKKLVIITESPIINSFNQDKKLRKEFDLILTWETNQLNTKDTFWMGCGCSFPKGYELEQWPREDARSGMCMIAGNKKSMKEKELYSDRFSALDYFDKSSWNVALFGNNWGQRSFAGWMRPLNKLSIARGLNYKAPNSYQGACENKLECMKKYKYSICYENSLSDNGYITEKIFDSMFSGCIPIYLGASNITEFVPEELFIQRQDFETNEALAAHLGTITRDEYTIKQNKIKEYAKQFKQSTFYDATWAKEIAKHCINLIKREN